MDKLKSKRVCTVLENTMSVVKTLAKEIPVLHHGVLAVDIQITQVFTLMLHNIWIGLNRKELETNKLMLMPLFILLNHTHYDFHMLVIIVPYICFIVNC